MNALSCRCGRTWHFDSSYRDCSRMVGNPYLTGLRKGCPSSAHNRGLALSGCSPLGFHLLQKTIQCLPIEIVALHENSPDLLSVPDIFQRIGVEQNQISDLALLDRPE